jgi:hypothetical protein
LCVSIDLKKIAEKFLGIITNINSITYDGGDMFF